MWTSGSSRPGGTSTGKRRLGVLSLVIALVAGVFALVTASSAVAASPPPVIGPGPDIVGTVAVGNTVSCEASYSPNVSQVTFNWLRDGAVVFTSSTTTDYTIVAADGGHALACKVTASDGVTSVNATSPAVQVPGSNPTPTPSPTQSGGGDCQSSLKGLTGSVKVGNAQVTYTASLPKAACEDVTVYGDTYTMPDSYDGSGNFNSSASPQQYIPAARATLVIPAGQTSVTVTKELGDTCGWIQADVYKGPQQDTVTYPKGSNGYIAGKILNMGDCPSSTPTPTPMPDASAVITTQCGATSGSVTFTIKNTGNVPAVLGVNFTFGDQRGGIQSPDLVQPGDSYTETDSGFPFGTYSYEVLVTPNTSETDSISVGAGTFVVAKCATSTPTPTPTTPATSTPTPVGPSQGNGVAGFAPASSGSSGSGLTLLFAAIAAIGLISSFMLLRRPTTGSHH